MFKRTRYQRGSVELEERKTGPAVWVYRWWEEDINGKLVHRKQHIGDVEEYPSESAAQAAADALRLTVNNGCRHSSLQRVTVKTLWEHYSREELALKALSTRDCYSVYAKNWILPRWGDLQLEQIRTVEVERWLRAADLADGTRAKIKCVMSALFSHAVRWEFCGRNPISTAAPVGASIGISGVGWNTFRHTVGTMLAEMGEHQLTIRDYLRHSNIHVTNKYLQATSKTKRSAHDKLIDAFLPAGLLPKPVLQ